MKIEFQKIDENFSMKNGSSSILDIVISKEDDIFCSLSLDFNIASEGETKEEAINNILEAIGDYIELALENNVEIYRPVPFEDNPLLTDRDSIVEFIKYALNIDLERLDKELYA